MGQLSFLDTGGGPLPRTVPPMRPVAAEGSVDSPDLAYELKWSGLRTLAFVQGGGLRLQSAGLRDVTGQWPELRGLPEQVDADGVVLDGEIVAVDGEGRSRFELLQPRLLAGTGHEREALAYLSPARFVAFDVLYCHGRPTMGLRWEDRRRLLERIVAPSDRAMPGECLAERGSALMEAARVHGLEGVVAKDRRSPYLPGRRSSYWTCFSVARRGSFVVGGYSFGGNGRSPSAAGEGLDTLLLGLYDGGRLRYVGQVAVGLDAPVVRGLVRRLEQHHAAAPPFLEPPDVPRLIHWCRPELVCRVRFAEWAQDGTLRFPVFEGVKPDAAPAACTFPVDGRAVV